MENMTTLDLGIVALIIFLSLKGLFNGFFKELFGLLGIVGGVFVGTRLGYEAGQYVNNNLLHLQNDSVISVTGFLVAFIGVWFGMTLLGNLFSTLSSKSGLGAVDKILGFIFSGTKIFLIIAIITHSLLSVKIIKEKASENETITNSVVIPYLQETGAYVVNADFSAMVEKAEKKSGIDLDETVEQIKDALPTTEEINNEVDKQVDEVQNVVKDKLTETE